MGQFLSMAGVIGCDEESVIGSLRSYAEDRGGLLEEAEPAEDHTSRLIVSSGISGVTALFPDSFLDWDDAAQSLSERLGTPVFSFHIHDSDLWMYLLFDSGEFVDQFNPVPDYWEELEDFERLQWEGDPEVVARCVPGVSMGQVSRYLRIWGNEIFESAERRKAYPTDQFYYGDDWQLVDFMRVLGLDFPLDDKEGPLGNPYQFSCQSRDIE